MTELDSAIAGKPFLIFLLFGNKRERYIALYIIGGSHRHPTFMCLLVFIPGYFL